MREESFFFFSLRYVKQNVIEVNASGLFEQNNFSLVPEICCLGEIPRVECFLSAERVVIDLVMPISVHEALRFSYFFFISIKVQIKLDSLGSEKCIS